MGRSAMSGPFLILAWFMDVATADATPAHARVRCDYGRVPNNGAALNHERNTLPISASIRSVGTQIESK